MFSFYFHMFSFPSATYSIDFCPLYILASFVRLIDHMCEFISELSILLH